jgi:Protein of unknown function (DUF3631)
LPSVSRQRASHRANVAEFIEEDAVGEAIPLHQRLADWMAAAADSELKGARPAMPQGVVDRKAKIWRALLAVADAAGGEWPDRPGERAVTSLSPPTRVSYP